MTVSLYHNRRQCKRKYDRRGFDMLWPESPLTQQFDAWSETLWFEYRQVGYHTWLKTLEARPVAPKNQTSFGRGPWMNYRNCIWDQRDANEQGMILYLYICVILSRTYKLHWFQDLVCARFFAGLGLRKGSGNCHYASEAVKRLLQRVWLCPLPESKGAKLVSVAWGICRHP